MQAITSIPATASQLFDEAFIPSLLVFMLYIPALVREALKRRSFKSFLAHSVAFAMTCGTLYLLAVAILLVF